MLWVVWLKCSQFLHDKPPVPLADVSLIHELIPITRLISHQHYPQYENCEDMSRFTRQASDSVTGPCSGVRNSVGLYGSHFCQDVYHIVCVCLYKQICDKKATLLAGDAL